jgi:hypothetical protein
MKQFLLILLLVAAAFVSQAPSLTSQAATPTPSPLTAVTAYPIPAGVPTNNAFTLSAEGITIPCYDYYVGDQNLSRSYYDDVLITNAKGETLMADGFETNSRNWIAYEFAGDSRPGHAHSGKNCIVMTWPVEYATHDMGAMTNAGISLWYGDATNLNTGQCMVQVGNTLIGVLPDQPNYVYSTNGGTNFISTGIKRTAGWKNFRFDFTSGLGASGYIDKTQVFTTTSERQFRYFEIGNWRGYHPDHVAVASFDMNSTKPIPVSLVLNGGTPTNVTISPVNAGIKPTIQGNVISFTLDHPRNLHIEVNGQYRGPYTMELFANPPVTDAPDTNAPNVLVYQPGIHDLKADFAHLPVGKNCIYFAPGLHESIGNDAPGTPFTINKMTNRAVIPEGVTVYVPGGAVVSSVFAFGGSHITFAGHGILWGGNILENHGGQMFTTACQKRSITQDIEGLTLRDFTILNSPSYGFQIYQVNNGLAQNIHILNAHINDDGLDIDGTTNFVIANAFIRNCDDNTCLYGSQNPGGPLSPIGDSHVIYTNCVGTSDGASSFRIGSSGPGQMFENIQYHHCTTIHVGNFALYIQLEDGSRVRNIEYDDCTIEKPDNGHPVYFLALESKHPAPTGPTISDVHLKNVSCLSSNHYSSEIKGYDAEHFVSDIFFNNYWSTSTYATNAQSARLKVGPYATNIIFSSTPTPTAH